MLKKQNRVNKHLFVGVVKGGVAYYSQNTSLKVIKTSDPVSRFSVYTPKKEVKSAVKRNLLRRRVQFILQKVLPKTKQGHNTVIFLKKGILKLPFFKLEDEVVFLLKKAKLF